MQKAHTRLPDETMDELDAFADERGLTRSAALRMIAKQRLEGGGEDD